MVASNVLGNNSFTFWWKDLNCRLGQHFQYCWVRQRRNYYYYFYYYSNHRFYLQYIVLKWSCFYPPFEYISLNNFSKLFYFPFVFHDRVSVRPYRCKEFPRACISVSSLASDLLDPWDLTLRLISVCRGASQPVCSGPPMPLSQDIPLYIPLFLNIPPSKISRSRRMFYSNITTGTFGIPVYSIILYRLW